MKLYCNDIILLLHSLGRSLHNPKDQSAELHELTLLQVQALKLVKSHQKITMGQLADELNISAASASALADRLIKINWLSREADPSDRRVVYLTMPITKRESLEKIFQKHTHHMEKVISQLSEPDQKELWRILRLLQSIHLKLKGEN